MKSVIAFLCAACACIWLTATTAPRQTATSGTAMPSVRQIVAQQRPASRSLIRFALPTADATTPTLAVTSPAPPSSPDAQPKTSPSPDASPAVRLGSVATRSPAVPALREAPGTAGPSVWDQLAQCESSGNWADTDGLYEGGLQFLQSTWLSMGGGKYARHAYDATREQQIEIAEKTLAASSWKQQWPACSLKLGLR